MKYRKKPVVIEAFRFGFDDVPEWFSNSEHIRPKGNSIFDWLEIETLEGNLRAYYGDYVIKGVKGEIYPCKSDIFEMTYERVDE